MGAQQDDTRAHTSNTKSRPRGPPRGVPTRGAPARPEGYKSSSSIPSKFETVLFTGPRERKGFGSEGKRFFDLDTDAPGPGSYTAKPLIKSLEFQHDSIGKKGFGSLCSGTQRFRHRTVYTGPGPGQYDSKAGPSFTVPCERANTTGGQPQANFHPKINVPREEQPLPGPGAYSPAETRTGQRLDVLATAQSHHSAFRAGGHQCALIGNLESPAPTKYSQADLWDSASKVGGGTSRSGSHACTSSFAGSRSLGALAYGMPALNFLEDPSLPASSRKPDTGPGPGSYDADGYTVRATLAKAAAKPSAMFQPSSLPLPGSAALLPSPQIDLCGSESGRLAGGASVHAVASSLGTQGVSAPFKSKSAGHGEFDMREVARAPGPAFYNPQSGSLFKKSFHLNAAKRMHT